MASRRQTEPPKKAEPTPIPATVNPAPPKAAAPKQKTTRAKTTAPATAVPATKPSAKLSAKKSVEISEHARRGMIAEAAYLRSERRGFMPGYEVEDWLSAEAEVDALLTAGPGGKPQ